MNWLPFYCRFYRRRLTLLAAGALAQAEKDRVEEHLSGCPRCARYYGEIKAVGQSLRHLEPAALSPEPGPALRERWRNAIEKLEPLVTRTHSRQPLDIGPGWQPRLGFASLAVIWLMIFVLKLTSPAPPQMAEVAPSLSDEVILLVLTAPAEDWPHWIAQRNLAQTKPEPPRLPKPRGEGPSGRFGSWPSEPQPQCLDRGDIDSSPFQPRYDMTV